MYKLLAQMGRIIVSDAISADIEETRLNDAEEYRQHAKISADFAQQKLQNTLSVFANMQKQIKVSDTPSIRVVK